MQYSDLRVILAVMILGQCLLIHFCLLGVIRECFGFIGRYAWLLCAGRGFWRLCKAVRIPRGPCFVPLVRGERRKHLFIVRPSLLEPRSRVCTNGPENIRPAARRCYTQHNLDSAGLVLRRPRALSQLRRPRRQPVAAGGREPARRIFPTPVLQTWASASGRTLRQPHSNTNAPILPWSAQTHRTPLTFCPLIN